MKLRMPWGIVDQSGPAAGSKRTGSSTQTSRSSAGASSTASLNRQIRSLVPGQTIRGEVISRNGGDVQLKLADDMIMQAKVDPNMNLEVGKNMTFEVRNNGSALMLSPLFENMSADVNVLKALDMAGLPVNEASVSMTRQMMEAGLPVDKNALLQMYREINSFPQAEVSDIVNLHKLGLPVNQENVDQMISYRNLTHQLAGGMDTVLGALPEAMEGMLAEGNLQGLSELYQELFALVQEGAGDVLMSGEELLSGQPEAALENVDIQASENADIMAAGDIVAEGTTAHLGKTPELAAEILLDELETAGGSVGVEGGENAEVINAGTAEEALAQTQDNGLSAASRTALSEQLISALSQLPMSAEEVEQLAAQLQRFSQGELSEKQLFAIAGRMMEAAQTAEGGVKSLHQIFSGADFRGLLTEQLKNLWMIKPEELAETGKVDDLYKRLDRQLRSLTQVLESGGQAESTAYRATVSMTQNIDFLNQLNQMYAYVQLPLHLSQGDAHGDLYVYANKKNLAQNDGKISALLHLDMEHLGPVDVYVTLEQSKVNTKFYVRDDEMLDFLSQHMDILTERLKKRGYDCSFSMTTRGDDREENSGIAPILSQEKGVLLSQYAFDVRT